MLAFVDQSGTAHPNDTNPGAILLAVCLRESTFFEVARAFHAIKQRYGWFDHGVPREIHAVECGSQRAYRNRNRNVAWRVFRKSLLAGSTRDVATLAIVCPRPANHPTTPRTELPPQYFFLLQRVEALASMWREGHATVVFDEENRKADRKRAFAYSSLLHQYWSGRYFSRLTGTALFGDSAANVGLELADMCAYVVFQEKFGLARPNTRLSPTYASAIGELAKTIQAKAPYLFDFHNQNEYHGMYNMPEKAYYARTMA